MYIYIYINVDMCVRVYISMFKLTYGLDTGRPGTPISIGTVALGPLGRAGTQLSMGICRTWPTGTQFHSWIVQT